MTDGDAAVGEEAARLVRRERDRLVSESPSVTVEALAQARDEDADVARRWVLDRRESGALIAVDHDGTVLVPSFQLTADYADVLEPVSEAVRSLTAAGMSDWATWRWFHVENPWAQRRPVDMVAAGDWEQLKRAADRLRAD